MDTVYFGYPSGSVTLSNSSFSIGPTALASVERFETGQFTGAGTFDATSWSGTLEVEGESFAISEGTALFVPAHADHGFSGYESLSVLVIFTRKD